MLTRLVASSGVEIARRRLAANQQPDAISFESSSIKSKLRRSFQMTLFFDLLYSLKSFTGLFEFFL